MLMKPEMIALATDAKDLWGRLREYTSNDGKETKNVTKKRRRVK